MDVFFGRRVHGARSIIYSQTQVWDDLDEEEFLYNFPNYRVSGVIIKSDAPPVENCEECAPMRVPLTPHHPEHSISARIDAFVAQVANSGIETEFMSIASQEYEIGRGEQYDG